MIREALRRGTWQGWLRSALAFSAIAAASLVASEARADGGGHYVFGIGGAFDLEMSDRRVNPGGTAFFEFEAIERWLEIEASVSFVKAANGTELASAVLLKKPFGLRPGIELMVGLGPVVVQTLGIVPSHTYLGLEGVLDFMFWPSKTFGVWVAPGWDLVARDRASLSFGTTVGPMIAW